MWADAIISGNDKTLFARALRLLLAAAAGFYGIVIDIRNWLYDHHWLKASQLPIPVICVGNITAGGTGKTPMVIWLCRYLSRQGLKVAILSRGYKGQGPDDNDETQLLRAALPDVTIVIDSNRLRGGQKAIQSHNAQVLVLDDGFQHRRLKRDLDIVMIDALEPFGYGSLIPRGLLREPLTQLRRADAIVITRADSISNNDLATLKAQIQSLPNHPGASLIVTSRHEPVSLWPTNGTSINMQDLRDKEVVAFCGIGNPRGFIATLTQQCAKIVDQRFFADHYHYSGDTLEQLNTQKLNCGAQWLVTTEKDWVKLKELPRISDIADLYWLRVELAITEGKEQFCAKLDEKTTQAAEKRP
jgi:tetraacyldisaccharide 4'-kinase